MIFTQSKHTQFMEALIAGIAFCGLLAACDSTASINPSVPLDFSRLPIGDGHLSTKPERGSVWACNTDLFGTFNTHGGPWIQDDGTFNLTEKVTVDGSVSWTHEFTVTRAEGRFSIVGNALPNHVTGKFPIEQGTTAYPYDKNPNTVLAQDLRLDLPLLPSVAAIASCLPMGAIGVLLTGATVFNALDANGEDAVAREVQDKCQGHPQSAGIYHYHSLTSCQEDQGTGHSSLVGYLFDGFGLYGYRGEGGKIVINDDLDECHGHTHEIVWDSQVQPIYHYHATLEYPYTIGCYRGQPQRWRPTSL